jgi:predicted nucleic acid-binding protein
MEYMPTIKFFLLDASAIVKFVIDEPGSDKVRELPGQGACHTTEICLCEAYGVISRKWKKGRIDDDTYCRAIEVLSSLRRNSDIRVLDNSFENLDDLHEAKTLFTKYSALIDLVDALQIISLKKGFYSLLAGDSQPSLVTADKDLSEVAIIEGLKVRLIQEL